VRPGGSAANQAAWLAAHGMAVAFIGRVGNDPFGTFNADDLQRRGVRTHLTRDAQHATGMVVVLVSGDGERTMLTDRGASRHLRPEYLPAEAFQTGTHFHLSGYVLLDEPTRPAALHALRLAHDAGMRVSVDPVAATLIREAGAARFLEWTQGAELCMPNLEEARALVGDGTLEEVAARLAEHYGEVVVSLGRTGPCGASEAGGPYTRRRNTRTWWTRQGPVMRSARVFSVPAFGERIQRRRCTAARGQARGRSASWAADYHSPTYRGGHRHG